MDKTSKFWGRAPVPPISRGLLLGVWEDSSRADLVANHAEAVDAEDKSNRSLRRLDFIGGRISDLHLQRTFNSKGGAERGRVDLIR